MQSLLHCSRAVATFGGMPKRIQRKRERGWRQPEGVIYVGRPTRWGNKFQPFTSATVFPLEVGVELLPSRVPTGSLKVEVRSIEHSLAWYRIWVISVMHIHHCLNKDFLAPLRGRDLSCWCPLDRPCHADILLELANK